MAAWIGYVAVAAAVLFAVTAAFLAKRGAALEARLQRTRADRRAHRRELAGSLDLDAVVARILESSVAVEGVDAAVLSLEGDEKGRLVKAAEMSQEEAERLGELGSKLSLPLEGELGGLGYLAVYSRSVRDLEREVGDELDDVVRRAVAALDNAFRYREARRLADIDALTGLRNRRYFHETLQRESARAQRYGRRLALLVLDVDDFKAINERVGHLAGDAVLAETAARVRQVLRASDIACRVGGDEFAIILPEAGTTEAAQLYRRVEKAVSASPIGSIARLTLSGGVAELTESDDAKTFFERADHALYRAKSAGKAQIAEASPDG
jgi:diguanylate cyclase (GGDEF)-like protein